MTREEFILQKQEIEEQMMQSRLDEHNAIAKINEKFEERLRILADDYRKCRETIFEERDFARREKKNEYKNKRTELFLKDCELIDQWRAQRKEGGEV